MSDAVYTSACSCFPPHKGAELLPNFAPISVVAKRLYCIRMPLGTEVGLNFGPGDVVLDGVAAP